MTFNVLRIALIVFSNHLARWGIIDADRGKQTVRLAWPHIVSGFARLSQRLIDLAMIGVVLGPVAIAGLAFAFAYWQIANQISLGLSGGAITLVSQRFGINNLNAVDLVAKQAVLIAILISIPFTMIFWHFPAYLIQLLGAEPEAVAFGETYLRVTEIGLVFAYLNKIASRILVGVDDALTPMYVRSVGVLLNILLNSIFIFELGLGVFGAALGTLLATISTTVIFILLFVGVSLPVVGNPPVTITLSSPYVDPVLLTQLLKISAPLMARWVAHSVIIFPFLAIVSVYGSNTVAAFEIGRRIRGLLNAPGWGFGLASSSLVGQKLGSNVESEAKAYAWDIIKFSTVIYTVFSCIVFVFASQVATLFVEDPTIHNQATVFIRVSTIAVIWMGIDETTTGALRGAGDTRWPLYGKLVGLYLFALPIAYFGTYYSIGIIMIYIAFVAETFIPASISFYRFRTDKWI